MKGNGTLSERVALILTWYWMLWCKKQRISVPKDLGWFEANFPPQVNLPQVNLHDVEKKHLTQNRCQGPRGPQRTRLRCNFFTTGWGLNLILHIQSSWHHSSRNLHWFITAWTQLEIFSLRACRHQNLGPNLIFILCTQICPDPKLTVQKKHEEDSYSRMISMDRN